MKTKYYLTYAETKTTVKKRFFEKSTVTVYSYTCDISSISENFDDVKEKYDAEDTVYMEGAEYQFVDKIDPIFGEYKEAGYRHKDGSEHTMRVSIYSYGPGEEES